MKNATRGPFFFFKAEEMSANQPRFADGRDAFGFSLSSKKERGGGGGEAAAGHSMSSVLKNEFC